MFHGANTARGSIKWAAIVFIIQKPYRVLFVNLNAESWFVDESDSFEYRKREREKLR